MSFTRDLTLGLIDYVTGQGVTAMLVAGDLPSEPDEAVGFTLYASDDPVEVARADVRLQAMCRGARNDSLSASDVADQLFGVLHGLEGLWIGDLHVALCSRISVLPLGIDGNKRAIRADNYGLTVDVPVTARRPA